MNSNKFITSAAVLAIAVLFAATAFTSERKAQPAAGENVTSSDNEKNLDKKDDAKKVKRHKGIHAHNTDLLSNLLGIDKDTLNEKLANGANVYELLKEAGKVEEYKQALLDAKIDKFNKLVEQGKLTREEADIKIENYKVKLDNWDGTTNIDSWYGKIRNKKE